MVEVQHLSYNFGSQWALKDINFSLGKGEFLFLTGHSGAGKTTLLRMLYGALPVTRGRATVAGVELHRLKRRHVPGLRRRVGVVFQDFKILPKRSVFDNVAMALEVRGMARSPLERRVRAIIRAMGLETKSYTPCERLSGGEQQRVAIARALANRPRLLLADEPTGNLDPRTADGVFQALIDMVRRQGLAALIATHNPDLARAMDRIIVLEDGQARVPRPKRRP